MPLHQQGGSLKLLPKPDQVIAELEHLKRLLPEIEDELPLGLQRVFRGFEWVDTSYGRMRADVAHRKLVALGYEGSERTTRRAVAAAKGAWRKGHRRTYRPWIAEPGMWFQFDFGDGPHVRDRRTYLFCAWLACAVTASSSRCGTAPSQR
jgi:hypothetical protein